ncbi:MAG: AEC family transporter [Burkholderiales bacterium]|nr:AEC family transporter [Burkholderiales bacterium]MCE7877059.1 AEC family transporter [Betaproteobacteria bacterium PRO3]
MTAFASFVALTAPLFALIALGFVLARRGRWRESATEALTRFCFAVAIPALLFRLMSDFPSLPRADPRVLLAYFGACFVVFFIGRLVSRHGFRHDGVEQSVFGLAGTFSNSVLLGIPLMQVTLGTAAMPTVSLVVVFNALVLWTLVSVSVEIARANAMSAGTFFATAKSVVANPVVASILAGTAFGFTGASLPAWLDRTLALLAQAAVPMSLVALGMGLGGHAIGALWRPSAAMTAMKLVAMPSVAWGLARLVGLPGVETTVVVAMAALPIGANVYLMARQFGALEAPVAAGLVLSTSLAAVGTPVVLALLGAAPP